MTKKSLYQEAFFLFRIMKYSLFYFTFSIIFFTELNADDFRKSDLFLLRKEYTLDEILDNGSYYMEFNQIKADVMINGQIGSGAVINIYHFSNISDSLQKQSKFLSLYNDTDNRRVTIQRKYKNNLEENLERIVLTIPKNINIIFKKCQGNISIENISGSINFDEHLGIISLNHLNGDLDLNSSNGDAVIQNSDLFSNFYLKSHNLTLKNVLGESNITILNGNVFINGFEGSLNLFSTSGFIELNEIRGNNINCNISSATVNGENISSDLVINGNDGSIQLKKIVGRCNVKTTDGDILIKGSKGSVTCTTSGGNITLKEISGSSDLESYFGNIYLNSIYDSSVKNTFHNISTIEGNIDLEIQKDLSLSLSAGIDFNRSTQDVTSQIPLNFELKDNKILGKAFINEGLLPIVLFSKNGYISIKDY